MYILRIEHKVSSYEGWKKAFEADPMNRKKLGVIRYRIFRPVDDPNYVIIDLEFERLADVENTMALLDKLWAIVEGTVVTNPQTRMLEVMVTTVV